MKNYRGNKMMLWLFAFLLSVANAQTRDSLPNFTRYQQEEDNTCWAACTRMVMRYYDVIKEDELARKEKDIRRLAFGTPDTEPALDRANTVLSTAQLLRRFLLTVTYWDFKRVLSHSDVRTLLDNGVPILAGMARYDTNDIQKTGHMYVIVGYRGVGNDMDVLYANPNDTSMFYREPYSDFIQERAVTTELNERWVESVYFTSPPPAPKNVVVDKISMPTKTITAGLNRIGSNEMVHVWDTSVYAEQVVVESAKSNVVIMSSSMGLSRTNPVIRSPRALSVLGAQGIDIQGIDISSDSVVYNTGELSLMHLKVSVASGSAIHNAGTLYLDYSNDNNNRGAVTVSAASGHAIYNNAGSVYFLNAAVSAASGYAAIYNNSSSLAILGETNLSTASGDSGAAIYNSSGYSGWLVLGNSPAITGRIEGFGARGIGVHLSGTYTFAPGDKKYTLAPNNIRNGDIVVINGASFIKNFELTDTNFVLMAIGYDLVAISSNLAQLIVGKLEAILKSITNALLAAKPGQIITISDGETYEEQVTIGDSLLNATIQSGNRAMYSRPKIKYIHTSPPKHYAGFKKLDGDPVSVSDIEDNSAVRIFGARGILIDGVDIEGINAVYNTGDVAIRNAEVSATSDYAIYNTGTIEISDATAYSESDYAVYNTGTLYLVNATLSTESGGGAIYNYGGDGQLVLAGSPTIIGSIVGFGAGKVSVVTTGRSEFAPNGKKYLLEPDNLRDGDVVVVGGSSFMDNFELTDTGFVLAVSGSDLVARSLFGVPPAIEAVYSDGLTLADIALPAGYVWVSPGTVLSEGNNQEFDAVYTDPSGDYKAVRGKVVVSVSKVVSVASSERVVPQHEIGGDALGVLSVDIALDRFSAGPVPVGKRAGGVGFFWQGRGIRSGVLYVYGSTGSRVKKIRISDSVSNNLEKRKVGRWDLTGSDGRAVAEGSYAVRGVVVAKDGKRQKVSVVLGVR